MNRPVCLVAILCLCAAAAAAARPTDHGRAQTLQNNVNDKTKEAKEAYFNSKVKMDALNEEHGIAIDRCKDAISFMEHGKELSNQTQNYAEKTKKIGVANPNLENINGLIATAEEVASKTVAQTAELIKLKAEICDMREEIHKIMLPAVEAHNANERYDPTHKESFTDKEAEEIIGGAQLLEKKIEEVTPNVQAAVEKTQPLYEKAYALFSEIRETAWQGKDALDSAKQATPGPNKKEGKDALDSAKQATPGPNKKEGEGDKSEPRDETNSKPNDNSGDDSKKAPTPHQSDNTDANSAAKPALALPTVLLFVLIAVATVQ